jgi:hypothetical protein
VTVGTVSRLIHFEMTVKATAHTDPVQREHGWTGADIHLTMTALAWQICKRRVAPMREIDVSWYRRELVPPQAAIFFSSVPCAN